MDSRTVIITGAGGKVGTILIDHFIKNGDFVVAMCNSEKTEIEIKNRYHKKNNNLLILKKNLMDLNAANELSGKLDELKCRPDVLINNARNSEFLKIEDSGVVERKKFMDELLLDVVVPYELAMVFSEHGNRNLKKIINIGSIYGIVTANPDLYEDPIRQSPIHYGVAKAALIHLTKELAIRLSGKNILVNCVAYGGIEGRADDAFKKRYSKLCPLGRMLNDNDIVGPVEFLLTDSCTAITGQVLSVDGGWSVR